MANVFKNILKNRGLRIRVIVFFLIVIFIPIMLNIYFIYSRTLDIVKHEKILASQQVLNKTKETLELNFSDISRDISDYTNSLGTGASIVKYHQVTSKYQESIEGHMLREIKAIVDNSYYIDDAYCVTNDGRVYSAANKINLHGEKFFESSLYDEVTRNEGDEMWFNVSKNSITEEMGDNEKILLLVRKIRHIIPEGTKEYDEENLAKNNKVVGYMLAYVNKEKISEIYKKATLNDDNIIIIYDQSYNPIKFHSVNLSNIDREKIHEQMKSSPLTKEINLSGKNYVIGLSTISPLNWHITSITPVESLIGAIKNELQSSLGLLALISIIVSLIIIIEILVLSKIITQKEMVDYRLRVSEDVNEKLRMYKHDFMNHLQIIQALLEMGHPDRAKDYLKNVAQEGQSIKRNYEIGIPELEATISSTIKDGEQKGIEVVVDTIELPEELPINLYDLMKIITNLIKNAMYALSHSEDELKVLGIRIDYSPGVYIFEITNNTPIISSDIRSKIFNKGYSTKGSNGDGLGLFIVKKLVNKYGGELELIVDKSGNRFIVTIPEDID
ncbi:Spo0B domain-containing protein [Sporosalibacterium faouarense]|uniref:Spo0B domain-containing protein n=1 Tax=Sporosalibacterium faouarense TaxID=516123 RepID=UPI00141D49D8|nr:ATP-binding protein [Sporosalibacterium faouarense]MTI49584.1 GHKL domain-containing protein [Bacillota bacterium]